MFESVKPLKIEPEEVARKLLAKTVPATPNLVKGVEVPIPTSPVPSTVSRRLFVTELPPVYTRNGAFARIATRSPPVVPAPAESVAVRGITLKFAPDALAGLSIAE